MWPIKVLVYAMHATDVLPSDFLVFTSAPSIVVGAATQVDRNHVRNAPPPPNFAAAWSISVAAISKESFRQRVAKALGFNVPGGIWRLLAIFLAVVNLKNLPFVWHVRPMGSLKRQIQCTDVCSSIVCSEL